MKIIIAGAGEVGFHVAKMLSQEEHDIVLLDKEEERLQHAEAHIDVEVIRGNALSIQLLEQAGVKDSDLVIAATSSEETNMSVAILAKHLGAGRTICRISNPEFQERTEAINMKQLGIDSMVFPEDLAARELHRLIEKSSLTDSFEFGDGKLWLIGIILTQDAPFHGRSLMEAVQDNPQLKFTVVAIQRKGQTIVPRGNSHFKANDHLYVIIHPECLEEMLRLTGNKPVKIKNIMVLGGGLIGREFARRVQKEFSVKLIEENKEKCFDLADELDRTMILHGDGSNVEFLEEEGIEEMDAFVAVTGDSETNIISCLVAKNHGVKRTIALVENIDYISLSQNIGIDTLINKKMITINNIFRHVREGRVEALTSIHGIGSEVLEFVVHTQCRIVDVPVKKLQFPRGAIIAGVIRGEESFIANGDTTILDGDRVVVFTLPEAIHQVEKFFK